MNWTAINGTRLEVLTAVLMKIQFFLVYDTVWIGASIPVYMASYLRRLEFSDILLYFDRYSNLISSQHEHLRFTGPGGGGGGAIVRGWEGDCGASVIRRGGGEMGSRRIHSTARQ